jgi:hypothetical protein
LLFYLGFEFVSLRIGAAPRSIAPATPGTGVVMALANSRPFKTAASDSADLKLEPQ